MFHPEINKDRPDREIGGGQESRTMYGHYAIYGPSVKPRASAAY